MAVRFFISQDVLDGLIVAEQASVDGEQLVVSSRNLEARVEPAVYFLREVEGKPDPNQLVGTVKSEEALAIRGADHFRKSVILGESAYDVVEGYLGTAAEGWVWPAGVVEQPRTSVPPPGMHEPPPAALAPPAAVHEPPPEADEPVLEADEPPPATLEPSSAEVEGLARQAHAVAPPPPDGDDDIPVELDLDGAGPEPTQDDVRQAVPGTTGKRASLAPDILRRLESSTGFRAPAAPPPEAAVETPVRRQPPRQTGGRSKLPTPAPAGARGSRPPPPPPPGARASQPPRPSSLRPGEPHESPAKTADELERLLLETIRPTRGKRR